VKAKKAARNPNTTIAVIAAVVVILAIVVVYQFFGKTGVSSEPTPVPSSDISLSPQATPTPANDGSEIIKTYFTYKMDGAGPVEGIGVVTRILDDDNDGEAHQRFILQLSNDMTLLIAHNIDVAPRLDGLKVGDTVQFYGYYYYNDEGGGIHWTHKSSDSSHVSGYLIWNGVKYE